MNITDTFLAGFVGAALALGYAGFQIWKLFHAPRAESEPLARAAAALRAGTNAYWLRQYITAAILFAAAVGGMFGLRSFGLLENPYLPFAFLSGGLWPLLTTFLGVKLVSMASPRMVEATRENLNLGLQTLLSAGAVNSFLLMGLGLAELTGWFFYLQRVVGMDPPGLAHTLLTFGLGASFLSLLLRAGGGMFFQGSDLGARLIDRGDASLPDGDARNPAAITRCVGGHAAAHGLGCDLYESYFLILAAAMALGPRAYSEYGMLWNAMLLPLTVAAVGVLSSLLGTALIRADERADQKALLRHARMGSYAAALLTASVSAPLSFYLLGDWTPCLSVSAGLLLGCLLDHMAEALVRDGSHRAKKLVRYADTGAAATVLGGFSTGMASLLLPLLYLMAGLLGAYYAGGGLLLSPDPALLEAAFPRGLYGVALAAVGLLSSMGLTGATGALGPLADSLRSFVRQAQADEGAESRADALDSLGCTLAASGRMRSTLGAALAALLLLLSYGSLLQELAPDLPVWQPALLLSALLGALLPLLFLSIALSGVQRGGQLLYAEVRRQIKEIRGILKGKADPDYAKCVDLCARHAIYQIILCILLAVGCPILVGLTLGPQAVTGLLTGVLATGLPMALWLGSAGSAWDNVRRYVESGRHGGSGSETHAAALTGDAIGAVLRDAAAPTLNVLMKLTATVSITALVLLVTFHI